LLVTDRRPALIAAASLLAATLFWAGNYVVGAAAVTTIDPLSLVFLRWAIALVPLLVIAQVAERPVWRDVLRAWPRLLLLAALGLLGYNLFVYSALQYTTAFNASLINAFNPALITIASVIFLRQRLGPRAIAGVLLALIGVLVVLSGGDLTNLLATGFGPGDALMLGAILVWTAYTIVGRSPTGVPPITATAIQAGLTVAVLAPVVIATGGLTLPATGGATGALLFIGLFPSVLSYLLWNRALAVIPPAAGGVFLNLITVYTATFTIITGKPLIAAQIIGGSIIIAGVVLASLTNPTKRAKRPSTTG